MQAGTTMADAASALGIRTEEASLVADLKAGSEEAVWPAHRAVSPAHLLAHRAQLERPPPMPRTSPRRLFIKVFRSIRSFNGDASLRTWALPNCPA